MSTNQKLITVAVVIVVIGVALSVFNPTGWSLFNLAGGYDIAIGGKQFTEQEVIGHMMATLIEENTDLRVNRRLNLGGTMICFNAIRNGSIDLYAEYTGTGLVSILDEPAMSDPEDVYNRVQEEFKDRWDLAWLDPFGFDNAYTLTMRKEQADELGIETISDLAQHVRSGQEPQLEAAFDGEFLERPDGYPGLQEAYSLTFESEPMQMDPGLMYKNCADGSVDVICAYKTDGRIPAYDLEVIEDDRNFFPPYFAAPLVRQGTLDEYPQLQGRLDKLTGLFTNEMMQQLNYEVDEEGRKPEDVAREFLEEQGLIDGGETEQEDGEAQAEQADTQDAQSN